MHILPHIGVQTVLELLSQGGGVAEDREQLYDRKCSPD